MIPILALLHRHTRYVFLLFFEDTSLFQHKHIHNSKFSIHNYHLASSKIKSEKKECEVSHPFEDSTAKNQPLNFRLKKKFSLNNSK